MYKSPVRPKPENKSNGFDLDAALSESVGNGNGNGKVEQKQEQKSKNGFDIDDALKQSLDVKKKDGGTEQSTTSTVPISKSEPPLPSQNEPEPTKEVGASVFDNPALQKIQITDFTTHDDPIGNTLLDLQNKRQDIIDKNLRTDNNNNINFHPIVNLKGKDVTVTKGGDEVENLDLQIDDVKQNTFADPTTAANYLKTKLTGKEVALKKNNHDDIGLGHEVAPITPNSDLNLFDQQSLKQNLNPQNITEQLAFDRIKKEQNITEALSTSNNLNEAALKFTAAQSPTVNKQITILNNSGEKLPDAYEGQIVSNFLDNPDLLKRAETNPELLQQIRQTKANLYNEYPTLGKRNVAQKISQEREDLGINNSFANIPTQESTDKIVDDMYKAGRLDDSEKAVYEKSIRPSLGVMNSIGRGIGRLIPGVQAAVEESPIVTPGFFENMENSYVNTLHGMARSIEDVSSLATKIVPSQNNTAQRLANTLQNDWSVVSINPKEWWRQLSQETGTMTGFVLPMIMGGAATKAVGLSGTAGELITNGLIFESQNKDRALTMFPDNSGKQFLYTTLATAGDMMLGKLIPTKEAQEGISSLLNKDITNVVNQFSDGEISAAAARRTILEKATEYVGKFSSKVLKGNIHTGAAIAGFGLLHNGLDAAFGGRDVNMGDAAAEAIENFKAGFMGGSVISAFAALGGNRRLNGDVLLEMASNPEHYKEVIENQAKINPDLALTKDEKIRNLNESALINKDLENTDLSNDKKGQYMIQALNEKVWQRKADQATNETLKNEYQSKANESAKIQKDILQGKEIPSQSKTNQNEENNGEESSQGGSQESNAQGSKENGGEGVQQNVESQGVSESKTNAPSIEDLKSVKLEGIEQKYKKVEVEDPILGKREISAQKAKMEYEKRHDILTKLVNCLT